MSDRQRLVLLAAILISAVSVPASSAQTADGMTPAPQVTPDASCLTRCGAARDRRIAELKGRNYWSAFDGIQCRPLAAGPNCLAQRGACRGACGTAACIDGCNQPFQSCCAAADQVRVTQDYDACVVQCPASKAPAEPVKHAPAGDLGKGATIDKKAEFAKMLNYANTMLQAVSPGLDGLDLERFNNLRRSLAFMQVTAALAQNGGRYAMVSGGGGRIWILRPDGTQKQLDVKTAAALRRATPSDEDADVRDKEAMVGMIAAGLAETEAGQILSNIAVYNTTVLSDDHFHAGGFPPGAVWYFPDGDGWSTEATKNKSLASSEHSSVRGTINGGGDFI